MHGLLNSLATKYLAKITKSFVFVNLGTTFSESFIINEDRWLTM